MNATVNATIYHSEAKAHDEAGKRTRKTGMVHEVIPTQNGYAVLPTTEKHEETKTPW